MGLADFIESEDRPDNEPEFGVFADLAEDIPTQEPGVRYCVCGCGAKLKGTKFSYVRGHKLNAKEFRVDQDPDPSYEGDELAYSPAPVRITVKIKNDIEGKAGMALGLISSIISARDPYCGNALGEAAPAIAPALVPIICKSPELVKYLTKAGNVSIWVDLAVAMAPFIKAVGQHHIIKTVGQNIEEVDVTGYPIP